MKCSTPRISRPSSGLTLIVKGPTGWFAFGGSNHVTQLFVYVLSTAPGEVEVGAIHSILLEVAGSEGAEDVVNAAEQLEQRGELRALRAAVARVLGARSVELSEVGRARLAACADVPTLSRWLGRAATASSEAEVFAGESAP
jgi:hypothetical protein